VLLLLLLLVVVVVVDGLLVLLHWRQLCHVACLRGLCCCSRQHHDIAAA
jgi:hypothetical protein